MAKYITEEKDAFLCHKINASFGCDMGKIVEGCKNRGRFRSWLGGDSGRVKSFLEKVKGWGIAPEFFAAYEINEGTSGRLGWLNHEPATGGPEADGQHICQWLKETSKGHKYGPAWDDPGGGTVGVVPADAKKEGNEHYKKLPDESIGQVYIAGTAAATWAAYYPAALSASVNHVQNYGDPIKGAIDNIRSWGGKITKDGKEISGSPGGKKDKSKSGGGKQGGALYIQNSNLWGSSITRSGDSGGGGKKNKDSNNNPSKPSGKTKTVDGNVFSDLITSSNTKGMNKGGKLDKVEYIVVHHNAATDKNVAMNTWLQSAGNDTSAHYEITPTEIIGCVGENYVAWHSGGRGKITNQNSIGIEHVNSALGNPNDAKTYKVDTKTIENGAKLAADICKRHKIPVDRTHIVGHNEVSSTGCPGPISVDDFVNRVKKYS